MNAQIKGKYTSNLSRKMVRIGQQRGFILTIIILTALLAFESFNFSTTNYALGDLLGNLTFAGLGWATILSIAFCGIDFAGIARLFTPDRGIKEANEVWYLFGGWILAATMNAIMTWWAVSMALDSHALKSTAVIDQGTLIKVVPVFVAVMVWLIRILIIGSLSIAGDRLSSRQENSFSQPETEPVKSYAIQPNNFRPVAQVAKTVAASHNHPMQRPSLHQNFAKQPTPISTGFKEARESSLVNTEPEYQPISASARSSKVPRQM
jgi:hypothetical protein